MGREQRIEFERAIYRVIQRGNNQEYIFNNEINKGYFIKCVKNTKTDKGTGTCLVVKECVLILYIGIIGNMIS